MERFLIYDSGCHSCNQLAEVVQDAASGRIVSLSIRDPRARAMLDSAYPRGWSPAPYLVFVEGERIRAWTGLNSATRLMKIVGLRNSWRIWKTARQHGVYLPPGPSLSQAHTVSRRHFLRIAGGFTAALVSIGLIPSTAAACDICCEGSGCCGESCYYVESCYIWYYCGLSNPYTCDLYACYDNQTGQFCEYKYNFCCCCNCIPG